MITLDIQFLSQTLVAVPFFKLQLLFFADWLCSVIFLQALAKILRILPFAQMSSKISRSLSKSLVSECLHSVQALSGHMYNLVLPMVCLTLHSECRFPTPLFPQSTFVSSSAWAFQSLCCCPCPLVFPCLSMNSISSNVRNGYHFGS